MAEQLTATHHRLHWHSNDMRESCGRGWLTPAGMVSDTALQHQPHPWLLPVQEVLPECVINLVKHLLGLLLLCINLTLIDIDIMVV